MWSRFCMTRARLHRQICMCSVHMLVCCTLTREFGHKMGSSSLGYKPHKVLSVTLASILRAIPKETCTLCTCRVKITPTIGNGRRMGRSALPPCTWHLTMEDHGHSGQISALLVVSTRVLIHQQILQQWTTALIQMINKLSQNRKTYGTSALQGDPT